MVKVAHISVTPLAGSPIRIVNSLNHSKYDIEARLIVFNEHQYGNRTYMNDLSWSKDKENCYEVIHSADILHFHHFFDLDSGGPFGESFIKMCADHAKFLRHYHSHPLVIARGQMSLVSEIIYSDIPSVVTAQFHERYYPNSLVIPNIIPIESDSDSYLPSKNRIKKRIGFSPTANNSAWNIDDYGFTRWDTKGAPETLSLLRKIPGVDIDHIVDLPHEECLRRKNNCQICIDELITGSYHISSLESLAMGIPTLAYLDPRTLHTIQDITGSLEHPWINCRLEEAFEHLSELLGDDVLVSELGQRSRLWMERYWNEDFMVKKFIDAYHSLLNSNRTLESPRFDLDNVANLWFYQRQYDINYSARKKRFFGITQ